MRSAIISAAVAANDNGEPLCCEEECGARATLRPVLLLRPSSGYRGVPARFLLNLPVCDLHLELEAEAFLHGFDALWGLILASQPGGDPPVRELTTLTYEAI